MLRGVDLAVPAGGLVALLGPSGCGKTTLLRCVAGLERPDSGEVRVADRVLSGPASFVAAERRRIGMVFQDAALFPHMSVARNVAYGLARRAPDRGSRVADALALVGLSGFEHRMPATLSGGQLQRVALARALAPRPSVILLDEPFSNLDAPLRAELRIEVRGMLTSIDATGLFVTHDQEEAFLVGDEVAEFIGDANFVPGVAAGGEAETALGAVPLHAEAWGPVEVMIRPERLVAHPGGDATVERIEYYGHDAVYIVALDGAGAVRSRSIGAPSLAPGARVSLEFRGAPTVAYPAAAAEGAAVPAGG